MSFLDHINHCNRWFPKEFLPFIVDGERLGLMRHGAAQRLTGLGDDFELRDGAVYWVTAPDGFDTRTEAMASICLELEQVGFVTHLHGERYPVTPSNRNQARFLIDRACAPWFGIRAFGQHLNGFVETDSGLSLWVAQRALDRRHYPNHYDNTVAGGLPWGISLRDNLRKECYEEAGIPADLADQAVPVSAVSYCYASPAGLKPDVMYCYDLELPIDFIPQAQDGEVAKFELWPIAQVIATVRDSVDFKPNCNLVIIDFLIRHGLISQDDPTYLELIQRLRSPLPFGNHAGSLL
jgi:isopentenyldiphosphate isomerase